MLCSDYTTQQLLKTPLKDPDLIKLRQTTCADASWVTWGNTQYDWILQTLKEWDANPNIIWKAAIQHYPMYPLHYEPSDFVSIVNYFQPILMAHKFDLYLCGHEHLLAYAEIPYAASFQDVYHERKLQSEDCKYNTSTTFSQDTKWRILK
jgi:hypothetical protein